MNRNINVKYGNNSGSEGANAMPTGGQLTYSRTGGTCSVYCHGTSDKNHNPENGWSAGSVPLKFE